MNSKKLLRNSYFQYFAYSIILGVGGYLALDYLKECYVAKIDAVRGEYDFQIDREVDLMIERYIQKK